MNPYGRSISNFDVIDAAACPRCCAFRKEPCSFNREEDPEGIRRFRKASHDERVILAKKNLADALDIRHITL